MASNNANISIMRVNWKCVGNVSSIIPKDSKGLRESLSQCFSRCLDHDKYADVPLGTYDLNILKVKIEILNSFYCLF